MASLSVIVPVLRDTPALRHLLSQLTALAPAPSEIIVVDAQHDADVAQLCAECGAVYLPGTPGRGLQLNAGAGAARGEALWFLHADAGLDPSSCSAISAALANGAESGYFRFHFAGARSFWRSFLQHCIAWRCRFGAVYGDQGLFMTREAWRQTGGFAEQPLFEEVPLVRKLRARRRFRALIAPIYVSPRRWERDGWLRRTLMNRLLSFGYILGIAPVRLARWYRSD